MTKKTIPILSQSLPNLTINHINNGSGSSLSTSAPTSPFSNMNTNNTNTPWALKTIHERQAKDPSLFKKEKPRKYKPDDFPSVFDQEALHLLCCSFPPWKLVKKGKKGTKVYDTVGGPYELSFPNEAFAPWVCGKAISTYPHIPSKPQRDGDPICDSYCIQLLEDNMTIAVVADGCNWGKRPMEASNIAKTAFVDYLRSHISDISDLRDIGYYLLQAISYCHYKICDGKEDIWEAGTTTLLGGILLPIKPSKSSSKSESTSNNNNNNDKSKDGKRYVWASVSIGDCKSYHFSTSDRRITDITEGNRHNVYDAKDCGGRLGPYVGEGEPDLRNVALHYTLCDEEDVIIILSDGVHDNLDPQTLGKMPGDIGPAWDSIKDWNDFPNDQQAQDAKTEYMLKILSEELICGGEADKKLRTKVFSFGSQTDESAISPAGITRRIIQFCLNVTGRGREWMEQNPKDRLPNDYALYPGKMDHATCVAIKVGNFDSAVQKLKESQKTAVKGTKSQSID